MYIFLHHTAYEATFTLSKGGGVGGWAGVVSYAHHVGGTPGIKRWLWHCSAVKQFSRERISAEAALK